MSHYHRKEIAKKIREAIFDRIEDDKCIHASSLDEEIEKGLAMAYADMSVYPAYVYSPGRGASAPIPETHTLTVAELPSCTHSHVSWTNDGIPTAKTTPALKAAFREWGERLKDDLAKKLFAQVEIIHPEAADK